MKKKHRPWRIYLLAAFAACLCNLQAQESDGYHLVWSEEFNHEGVLDESVWNYEEGFVRNHEWQWYQRDNAICRDGSLVITARQEKRSNPNYVNGSNDWRRNRENIECTSACVTTAGKKEFLYGRFEVRARIPAVKGSWPAIWLLGSGQPWPSCGEVDMMEYYHIDGVPHILANVAWGDDQPYHAVWDSQKVPYQHFYDKDPYWSEKFHVWRMDWTEEAIRLYLDDELLNETLLSETVNGAIGNHSNPYHRPMYFLLNLAMGGDNGGPVDVQAFPLHYEVDYVRVYQKSSSKMNQSTAKNKQQAKAQSSSKKKSRKGGTGWFLSAGTGVSF